MVVGAVTGQLAWFFVAFRFVTFRFVTFRFVSFVLCFHLVSSRLRIVSLSFVVVATTVFQMVVGAVDGPLAWLFVPFRFASLSYIFTFRYVSFRFFSFRFDTFRLFSFCLYYLFSPRVVSLSFVVVVAVIFQMVLGAVAGQITLIGYMSLRQGLRQLPFLLPLPLIVLYLSSRQDGLGEGGGVLKSWIAVVV